MPPRNPKKKKEKVLRPIFPNAGLEAAYRKRLYALIDEMQNSVLYWIKAAWRANEPEMAAAVAELAEDELPVVAIARALRKLTQRWRRKFTDLSKFLGNWFVQSASDRSDAALRAALKRGGMSVEFKMTPAQRDVIAAATEESVSLIKSIPERYLTDVEGLVMRSAAAGRDLGTLTKEIRGRYGVTKRRAALIARDQNNKVHAQLQRARQIELGIKEAVWMHSSAGKKPRWQHVKMNGQRYNVVEGMWDPVEKKKIFPGQLINCRCTGRSVVPGFT